MKFHNVLVDHVRAQGLRADQVFGEARRLTRWHFQWVVVHDFLPRLVGQELVDQILEERSGQPAKVKLAFYKPINPHRPMMPVEFSVAAYRFGHSMIRPRYTLNDTPGVGPVPIFGEHPTDRNLNGSRPIPRDLVIQGASSTTATLGRCRGRRGGLTAASRSRCSACPARSSRCRTRGFRWPSAISSGASGSVCRQASGSPTR